MHHIFNLIKIEIIIQIQILTVIFIKVLLQKMRNPIHFFFIIIQMKEKIIRTKYQDMNPITL